MKHNLRTLAILLLLLAAPDDRDNVPQAKNRLEALGSRP
jgi:hypothetical protein